MTDPTTEVMKKIFLYQFDQGFLTEAQIQNLAGLGPFDLDGLIEQGYIQCRKSYFDDLMLYFPTRKAQAFLKVRGIKVYVEYLKNPPAKNELHDRRLTDIRILMEQKGYPEWQSERCLLQRGMRRGRP